MMANNRQDPQFFDRIFWPDETTSKNLINDFSKDQLLHIQEDVPLSIFQDKLFQQIGYPAHSAAMNITTLMSSFKEGGFGDKVLLRGSYDRMLYTHSAFLVGLFEKIIVTIHCGRGAASVPTD